MITKIKRKIIYIISLIKKNINSLKDYRKYAKNFAIYIEEAKKNISGRENKSLLIVSGRGMNISWAQIWTLISLSALKKGYKLFVLTYKKDTLLNKYYSLMPIQKIYYEDLNKEFDTDLPTNTIASIQKLQSFEDYKCFYYNKSPLGQIALSTYSRHIGTGLIEIEKDEVKTFVNKWLVILIKYMIISDIIFKRHNIKALLTAEVFLEEYGAIYYSAITAGLNVIRTTGTVRDDAILFLHLSNKNDRFHQGSIPKSSFEYTQSLVWSEKQDKELSQNFIDRYGNKWHRSKRNQPNTFMLPIEEMRKRYNIPENKKVSIIYSHILYDSLFFFGTDLFASYAEWLIESVKAACENNNVEWFVKVHPSNLWRGELNSMLNGKYEEVRLIESAIGTLPPHIRIIPADNDGISPYSWFQFADYGITVRGTSGLEMAALGQTVICAGTGRYEGNGFTVDPKNKEEYISILKNIQEVPKLTDTQKLLAKKYAHTLFIRKPFHLTSFTLEPRYGVKTIKASDDIIYLPNNSKKTFMTDINIIAEWLEKTDRIDLLEGVDYALEK